MKVEKKIIALSISFGLFVWVVDAVLDFYFFYEGTFWELLIYDVPKHEVYIRSVILASFMIFGILIGSIMVKRKKAEEALQESEERYRDLYENAPNAYLSIDPVNGSILRCNLAASQLLGFDKETILRMKVFDLYADTPHGLPKAQEVFRRFKAGETIGDVELQMKHLDGHLIWISLSVEALKDDKGNVKESRSMVIDISERKRAEEALKASLEEKKVLLREIHHRVKNNMQVISSLLRLQFSKIDDKQHADMFKESQDRIKSMALIHEKLYQSEDLAHIDFSEYVKTLVTGLFRSHGVDTEKISTKLEVEGISLELDNAITCGLIINELVSNSLKYAFPQDGKGEIRVALRSINENEVELTVSDNGVGIPENLDFKNTESLGLHLVTILSEDQLHGKINLNRVGGTKYHIRFKKVNDKVRI